MSKVFEFCKKHKLAVPILATLFVLVTFEVVWLIKGSDQDRGTFGDLFGFVNALFSGFAFIGVIHTILLQTEELQLQREELKATREELKRTADAQVSSEKQLEKQNIFNLISAQLNATSTLINSYQSQIDRIYSDPATRNFASLRPKLLEDKVSELNKSVEVLLDECNKLKNP